MFCQNVAFIIKKLCFSSSAYAYKKGRDKERGNRMRGEEGMKESVLEGDRWVSRLSYQCEEDTSECQLRVQWFCIPTCR